MAFPSSAPREARFLVHMSRNVGLSAPPGKPTIVGDFGFELVCEHCLETRGVLESERLPEVCPSCGARGAWKGPFAERFSRDAEQLTESPFYLAASRLESERRYREDGAGSHVERQLG